MASFKETIAPERERLTAAIADVDDRMQKLIEEADSYKRELKAVDAYEAALAGKATTPSGRAPRGSRNQTLLAMIKGSAKGMSRADILQEIGAKGNKSQEGSISNALATMKKAGQLTLSNGVYKAA